MSIDDLRIDEAAEMFAELLNGLADDSPAIRELQQFSLTASKEYNDYFGVTKRLSKIVVADENDATKQLPKSTLISPSLSSSLSITSPSSALLCCSVSFIQ